MNTPSRSLLLPTIVHGMATAVVTWLVAFALHLPGLDLPTSVRLGAIALAIVGAGAWTGTRLAGSIWLTGAGSGAVAGLINLLLLGSMLVEQTEVSPDAAADALLRPNATLIAIGSVVLTSLLTLIGATAWRTLRGGPEANHDARVWPSRAAYVTAIATGMLIVVGGLVTSTGSGLAVPDWPTSYGANMFLYPLALMSDHRVYLEHSHRLFGTLVGLCTIITTVIVLVRAPANWQRIWAVALLVLVIVQGVMGGIRVEEQSPYFGMIHGVTAQIFLALTLAFAVAICPYFADADKTAKDSPGRKRKKLANAALHVIVLQLILGAAFRHLQGNSAGASHALYAHMAFALVVLILALAAGFACGSYPGDDFPARRTRRLGKWIVGSVGLQFALGWAAFFVVFAGDARTVPLPEDAIVAPAEPILDVLITAAHQGNGALLLSLATMAAVWTRRLGSGE